MVEVASSIMVEVASIIIFADDDSIIIFADEDSIIILEEDSSIIFADVDSAIMAEVVAIGAMYALTAGVPMGAPSVIGIPLGDETAGSLMDESGRGAAMTPEKRRAAPKRGARI